MAEFSFQSDLANMLFDTPAESSREVYETELVERFRATVQVMTSAELFRAAPKINGNLLPRLSGRNFLAVAKLMELRAPAALANMSRLRDAQRHAQRVSELAQILSPKALDRVIEALKAADQPT